ncbi:MAG: apolipoprotein N-acyltransferase [Candidatus Marinimicrobia bacterium CG08_land_8_20_14_0_20_45_22]|nr:MAG: apolipoprotein N-acyltransferase [Candidatus Marinimicrobia bacterium CG08_land_8_20_14_0_20_45_22]
MTLLRPDCFNFRDFLGKIPSLVWIILSGLMTFAAFPPSPLGFLASVSLIPFIYAMNKDDFHLGMEKGFIYGIFLNLGILFWLALNKGTQWYWATLSMASGVLFLSLNYAAIGLIVGIIGRRLGKSVGLLSFPFVWIAIEYLRSFGTLGFTWNNLCYTQAYAVQLIQMANVIGPGGVGFWIVAINVLIYFVLFGNITSRKIPILLSVLFLLFFIPETYGIFRLKSAGSSAEKRMVHVGIVQPNVDPTRKWDRHSFYDNMQLLHDLTDSVAVKPLDLVVWPETATPTFLRQNRRGSLADIISHITRLNVSLLTGTPDFEWLKEDDYEVFNSTFLLRPNSYEIEDYRKIQLVPFGEYIPLSDLFPELENLNLGQGNFKAGKTVNVFRVPLKVDRSVTTDTTLGFTTVVCYESTFPSLIREGAKKGSELLVIVSNDAWFGYMTAPFLHAEISRFRAIENGIPVVRSANTGISLVFDSRGREICRKGFGEKGWLDAVIEQGEPTTPYVRFGDWVAMFCVAISTGLIVVALIKKRGI